MQSGICFCITVGLVLLVGASKGSAGSNDRPCYFGGVNGCSVPSFLDVPFKKQFTKACDRHDVCYGCGLDKKYSISRLKCDNIFLQNMRATCQSGNSDECLDYANLYYSAVRLFGDIFRGKHPSDWCNHKNVPQCVQ